LVGAGRAKDLILTGRQVDAEEAFRIGLADRVVPAADTLDAALELARQLGAGPLVAQGYAKAAIDAGLDGTLAEGLDREQELFAKVFTTDDARIGVQSFLANGPGRATFTGR
jgi:enoyl-CoA hydratase